MKLQRRGFLQHSRLTRVMAPRCEVRREQPQALDTMTMPRDFGENSLMWASSPPRFKRTLPANSVEACSKQGLRPKRCHHCCGPQRPEEHEPEPRRSPYSQEFTCRAERTPRHWQLGSSPLRDSQACTPTRRTRTRIWQSNADKRPPSSRWRRRLSAWNSAETTTPCKTCAGHLICRLLARPQVAKQPDFFLRELPLPRETWHGSKSLLLATLTPTNVPTSTFGGPAFSPPKETRKRGWRPL